MKNRKRIALIIAALAAFGAAGGLVAANAQTAAPTATTSPEAPAWSSNAPDQKSTGPAADKETGPEGSATDPDNVQEGDETSPDTGAEVADEKEGAEGTEKEGVEEPGDKDLPGGGHADPEGQDTQHEFNGVE